MCCVWGELPYPLGVFCGELFTAIRLMFWLVDSGWQSVRWSAMKPAMVIRWTHTRRDQIERRSLEKGRGSCGKEEERAVERKKKYEEKYIYIFLFFVFTLLMSSTVQ